LSDDGSKAISLIGFIGSVFSPWYRWSGRRNPADNCCLNVALYGKGARRLIIEVNERATPHAQTIAGTVTIEPSGLTNVELPLTQSGTHVWRPFAPTARIKVDLARPGWQWEGHGYFDANFGTAALEADFSYWTWARLPLSSGSACFYDVDRRDGTSLATGVRFAPDGTADVMEMPPKARLNRSLWALRRETRADAGTKPRQIKHMLDAPFYCRSAITTMIHGEETIGVHEALDLNRFASPFLMPMLAVRVPRRARWR